MKISFSTSVRGNRIGRGPLKNSVAARSVVSGRILSSAAALSDSQIMHHAGTKVFLWFCYGCMCYKLYFCINAMQLNIFRQGWF